MQEFVIRGIVCVIVCVLAVCDAGAQPCLMGWRADFPTGNLEGAVNAWAEFDHGSGPEVYAGGYFARIVGGPNINVARWTPAGWAAAGQGVGGPVNAMAVFDDGSGPALYVAGEFSTASGQAAANIARWDGVAWSPVGGGLAGPVHALAVYDDGVQTRLIAGGAFQFSEKLPVNRVAAWDGTAWAQLGVGMNDRVRALAVFDAGGGPALYAGGDFSLAGGLSAVRLAKWDGSAWSAAPGALTGSQSSVRALLVHTDAAGPAMYVGGSFTISLPFGEPAIVNVGRLDAAGWSRLGNGLPTSSTQETGVLTLAAFGAGPQSAVYAGGSFTSTFPAATNLARWNGSAWIGMSAGVPISQQVRALRVMDAGSGPRLFVGGQIDRAGPFRVLGLCTWTGTAWAPLGNSADGSISAILGRQEGSVHAVYVAGGELTGAAQTPVAGVARWDGSSWTALGTGIARSGLPPVLVSLVSFDDGSGPGIFVAGTFDSAGGQPASNIAKWNGSGWVPLGAGLGGPVWAMAVHDDGSGPSLYVGGQFHTAGSTSAVNLARWNGTAWSRVSNPGVDGTVQALLSFDAGTGPALYVGGQFSQVGTVPASRIARWSGGQWASLGSGFNNHVKGLAVFDDGSGAALHACGQFVVSGTTPLSGIAKWTGTQWASLATGIGGICERMIAFNDGTGPALYVGGTFSTAGTVTSPNIIRWDGTAFTPMAPGDSGTNGGVSGFAVHTGPEPRLLISGNFQSAGGVSAGRIAAWGCVPPPPCYANCDGSTAPPVLNVFDFACFLNRYGAGDAYANCDASTTPPTLNVIDFACFLNAFSQGCP